MIQLNEYLINKQTKEQNKYLDDVKKYFDITDPKDLKMMQDAIEYKIKLTSVFKEYEDSYKKRNNNDCLFNTESWIIVLYPIALLGASNDKNAMQRDFFCMGYKGFKYKDTVQNPYDGAWHECFWNGEDTVTIYGQTFDTPLGMVQTILEEKKIYEPRVFEEACNYYDMFLKYPKSWDDKNWFIFYNHD